MENKLQPAPSTIITTELQLGEIYYEAGSFSLLLLVCCGDIDTCSYRIIFVETDFDTLNRMIGFAEDEYTQYTIDRLIDSLNSDTPGVVTVKLAEIGVLIIDEFIMSLIPITELDEEGNEYFPPEEDQRYRLQHFTPTRDLVPPFCETSLGNTPTLQQEYYNNVLATRFLLYVSLLHSYPEYEARLLSKLDDPAIFSLAKLQATKLGG